MWVMSFVKGIDTLRMVPYGYKNICALRSIQRCIVQKIIQDLFDEHVVDLIKRKIIFNAHLYGMAFQLLFESAQDAIDKFINIAPVFFRLDKTRFEPGHAQQVIYMLCAS